MEGPIFGTVTLWDRDGNTQSSLIFSMRPGYVNYTKVSLGPIKCSK